MKPTPLGESRRDFLQSATLTAGLTAAGLTAAGLTTGLSAAEPAKMDRTSAPPVADAPHLACNEYPWATFYRREKKDFRRDLDAGLAEVAAAGYAGFEPLADSPELIDKLVPLLKKHKLEMRSLYVNSTLHDAEQVRTSSERVLAIAGRALKLADTRIIVTNPSPIRWGGSDDKSDDQLRVQAEALDKLGARLRAEGLVLAYHNHDAELRRAAREFHHMLTATDAANVTFCLDAHWVFRGAGDSQVALFDVVKLYGSRVRELHLRQSRAGVWTESFGDGDIDYRRLFAQLGKLGLRPHVVLEQAVEARSPSETATLEAQRLSREYAARLLSDRA